jgi:hypothetical protein
VRCCAGLRVAAKVAVLPRCHGCVKHPELQSGRTPYAHSPPLVVSASSQTAQYFMKWWCSHGLLAKNGDRKGL